MFEDLSFFPEAASTFATSVDGIYLFLVVLTAFASVSIFSAIIFFAVRYRRRKGRTAAEIESKTNAVRQRYNVGEKPRKPPPSQDGATLGKIKDTLSSGLQQATETGESWMH